MNVATARAEVRDDRPRTAVGRPLDAESRFVLTRRQPLEGHGVCGGARYAVRQHGALGPGPGALLPTVTSFEAALIPYFGRAMMRYVGGGQAQTTDASTKLVVVPATAAIHSKLEDEESRRSMSNHCHDGSGAGQVAPSHWQF